uniref:Elongin-C n=1 Tax=Strigamia maritima TaxID=126957 RepID=T1IQU0_STRMM
MADSDLHVVEKPVADVEKPVADVKKPVAPIEKPFYKYGSFVDEGSDDDCIGSDSQRSEICRDHAIQSETIKAMLSGPGMFAETEVNEVKFREIDSQILEEVCKYLAYKLKYHESHEPIPDFPIHLGIVLDLLMAANFLAFTLPMGFSLTLFSYYPFHGYFP